MATMVPRLSIVGIMSSRLWRSQRSLFAFTVGKRSQRRREVVTRRRSYNTGGKEGGVTTAIYL